MNQPSETQAQWNAKRRELKKNYFAVFPLITVSGVIETGLENKQQTDASVLKSVDSIFLQYEFLAQTSVRVTISNSKLWYTMSLHLSYKHNNFYFQSSLLFITNRCLKDLA